MTDRDVDEARVTTGMRAMLAIAAALVLIIGTPAFWFPQRTDTFFAWTIDVPIMAASLGASYLSASLLEAIAARQRSWAQARIAVPAVLTFTVATLVVTLLHIGKFHLHSESDSARVIAWVWLVVYATVPLIMGGLWLTQARTSTRASRDRGQPMPAPLRAAWTLLALILLPVGCYLLVAPLEAAQLWPWALTALTGRATGAWLLGLGVLCAHAVYENDLECLRPAFPAVICFSLLQGLVLLRFGQTLHWTSASPWIYALVVAAWGVTAACSWLALRARSAGERAIAMS